MLFADISSFSFYIAFFLNIVYYLASFFVPSEKKHKTNLLFSSAINLLVIISFATFILSFVYLDFSLYSVFANSHSKKPLIYKIGAAWSSHEGSMLFWLSIMAIYSSIHVFFDKDFLSHHIQSFIQLILHAFIIISANPFQRIFPIPIEGNGFNPLLQDYSLLIHPPILYLGYAGNSISFAKVLSLSIRNDFASWKKIKSWVYIPWFFLTFGITLGSLWSYRELGWGGFWAWDPVENVSLLPWFAILSFIHLLLIKEKTYLINYLLKLNGILIFIFSLFSTFVVRSGLVSSVHAFAKNEVNGWYFLILLGFFTIFGFFIIIKYDKNHENPQTKNSNKLLLYGANFFSICYLIIIFAIVIPIYLNLYHNEIVNVSETFYQKSFGLIFIPILLMILYLPFRNEKLISKKNIIIALSTIVFAFYFEIHSKNTIAIINLIFSIAIFFSYLTNFLFDIFRKKNINPASFFCHIGIAIMIYGAIFSTESNFSAEKMMDIDKNNEIAIDDYKIILRKINVIEGGDFVGIKGDFAIWHKNYEVGFSSPELKFYKIEKMQLPDSSSFYHHMSDIYIIISGVDGENNKLAVKVFYKKYVMLVWIGLFCIIFGSFIGIFQHRKLSKFLPKQ